MKVLYCNPIFLDYRLPFYKRLNELLKFSVEMPCLLKMKDSSILMKCLSKNTMEGKGKEYPSQKD